MKVIEMTGKTTEFGFKTKEEFLEALAPYGFVKGAMKKKNNTVDILVTNSKDSITSKMELAKELGIEIMTYGELADLFGVEPAEE